MQQMIEVLQSVSLFSLGDMTFDGRETLTLFLGILLIILLPLALIAIIRIPKVIKSSMKKLMLVQIKLQTGQAVPSVNSILWKGRAKELANIAKEVPEE
jgi:hypothetical protein